MESKYLKNFLNLKGKTDLFRLNGGRVVVEILPKAEVKTQGGLIMSAPSGYAKGATFESQQGTLCMVLLVGSGYYDSDGNSIEIDLAPGNVVLVNDFGVKVLSVFPGLNDYTANSLAVIDESIVQMAWDNLGAFHSYSKLLNGAGD